MSVFCAGFGRRAFSSFIFFPRTGKSSEHGYNILTVRSDNMDEYNESVRLEILKNRFEIWRTPPSNGSFPMSAQNDSEPISVSTVRGSMPSPPAIPSSSPESGSRDTPGITMIPVNPPERRRRRALTGSRCPTGYGCSFRAMSGTIRRRRFPRQRVSGDQRRPPQHLPLLLPRLPPSPPLTTAARSRPVSLVPFFFVHFFLFFLVLSCFFLSPLANAEKRWYN